MTRLNKLSHKLTAIILCILLILATLCTYAHVKFEGMDNTQFFAAPFYLSFKNAHPSSRIGTPKMKFVSWIRPFEATFDTDKGNLQSAFIPYNLTYKSLDCTSTAACTSCSLYKQTTYFLRI